VLVHGGGCGSWCWEPLLAHLPGPVLAVDLPPREVRSREGRHSQSPALFECTVGDWADAVIEDLDRAGIDRCVLVGHSLGGLTIAEVARRAPERVARLVFVSASVPAEGESVLDLLPDELASMSRAAIEHSLRDRHLADGGALTPELARQMFCNDLDDTMTALVLDRIGTEVIGIIGERVSRAGIPPDLPKTFVKLLRDQSLPPELQDTMVANLEASPGGPVDVVELDAGHMAMLGQPAALAAVLLGA
jgi:pimeloyl-ACP methyl ester carboxylesterase